MSEGANLATGRALRVRWPPGAAQINPARLVAGLPVGHRICVLWEHGWEWGAVQEVLVELDGVYHVVAYDDGEVRNEYLEWVQVGETTAARKHDGMAHKGAMQTSPRRHKPPDRYNASLSSTEYTRLMRAGLDNIPSKATEATEDEADETDEAEDETEAEDEAEADKEEWHREDGASYGHDALRPSVKRQRQVLARQAHWYEWQKRQKQRRERLYADPCSRFASTVAQSNDDEHGGGDASMATVEQTAERRIDRDAAIVPNTPPTYPVSASGWPLIRSERNIQNPMGGISGYKNVTYVQHRGRAKPAKNPWQAKKDKNASIGLFPTAEAAAEAYSRYLGFEAATRLAQSVNVDYTPAVPMTEEQAFAAAAREGLTLRRSSKNASGFYGVTIPGNIMRPYCAYVEPEPGASRRSLGVFSTAAEAALVIARHRRAHGSKRVHRG